MKNKTFGKNAKYNIPLFFGKTKKKINQTALIIKLEKKKKEKKDKRQKKCVVFL